MIMTDAHVESKTDVELNHAGAAFTSKFISRLHPSLPSDVLEKYQQLILREEIQISDLKHLGHEQLQNLGFDNVVANARIISAVSEGEIRTDPPQIDGKPVEVQVRVGVSLFGDINTVNQSAFVKFFFDLHWYDPSLIGVERESVPSYIWRPDAYLYNALAGSLKEVHDPVLLDSDTGLMLQALQYEAVINNPMDLTEFPFDSDAVTLHFMQAENQSADEYLFVPWKDDLTVATRCFFDIDNIPEWRLRGYSMDYWKLRGGGPNEFAQMFLHLHVKRQSSFYLWKIVLPLFLSTLLCFSSLFFPLDELSDRNATSLTMFLATAALLYVVSSLLPKTSFLTRIDKFVVWSLIIQFVVAAISWIVVGSFGDLADDTARDMNDAALIALPAVYALITLYYFLPPLIKNGKYTPDTRPEYPITHLLDKEKDLEFYKFEWYHNVFI